MNDSNKYNSFHLNRFPFVTIFKNIYANGRFIKGNDMIDKSIDQGKYNKRVKNLQVNGKMGIWWNFSKIWYLWNVNFWIKFEKKRIFFENKIEDLNEKVLIVCIIVFNMFILVIYGYVCFAFWVTGFK